MFASQNKQQQAVLGDRSRSGTVVVGCKAQEHQYE